jgi:hypothetical protein
LPARLDPGERTVHRARAAAARSRASAWHFILRLHRLWPRQPFRRNTLGMLIALPFRFVWCLPFTHGNLAGGQGRTGKDKRK